MLKTFLNKKNILKILITISLIGITVLAFILSDYFSKNYKNNEKVEDNTKVNYSDNSIDSGSNDTNLEDGLVSVYIDLIDKNGNVVFSETRREEDKTVLYDVLIKYHDVRAESSVYGMIIFDIDSVKTKFYSESYISILVNNKYSSFGVSNIYVYDGIRVTFKEVVL